MTHVLVLITVNDDGDEQDDPQWHLYETDGGGPHALCTGEFVGQRESECVYELKEVNCGVPCPNCRDIVKHHKTIKL